MVAKIATKIEKETSEKKLRANLRKETMWLCICMIIASSACRKRGNPEFTSKKFRDDISVGHNRIIS